MSSWECTRESKRKRVLKGERGRGIGRKPLEASAAESLDENERSSSCYSCSAMVAARVTRRGSKSDAARQQGWRMVVVLRIGRRCCGDTDREPRLENKQGVKAGEAWCPGGA